MLVMIDNYDSFTYNLVQYFGMLAEGVEVYRNDAITVAGVIKRRPDMIVISPGPGRPEDAGISCALIRECAPSVPMLGVCLGHQAIGYAFGGRIIAAKQLMHGKVSDVYHTRERLYRGIPDPFEATRYHSLVIERRSLPSCLKVTAWTKDGEIMGVKHTRFPLWGVQFHPESVLTTVGLDILRNFLDAARATRARRRRQ